MVQKNQIPAEFRERIIQGKNNWWFLGPTGIARLKNGHLTGDGKLTPSAESYLRDKGLFAVGKLDTYVVTVLTSTDCNLGCGYCFQNTAQDASGGSRPPRIAHSRLTSRTISDILDFAARQMSAAGMEKLHILLFGGEPLLNPRGCKELLARAADYGLVSASMISNGTLLLPAVAKELADLGLKSIQITFDGNRAQHDLIRVRRSGGGTFEAIIENLTQVSRAVSLRWQIRVNVSHHNYAGIDDLIDTLAARLDPASCSIHFAWVADTGIGYANGMHHTAALARDFFRWHRHALEAGFRVSRPGAHRPCATCSFTEGRYGAVVNADGTLSSCWETAGQPGWQVGTAADGYLPSVQTQGRWVSCHDGSLNGDGDQAVTSFHDISDAAFLDYLDETGRL